MKRPYIHELVGRSFLSVFPPGINNFRYKYSRLLCHYIDCILLKIVTFYQIKILIALYLCITRDVHLVDSPSLRWYLYCFPCLPCRFKQFKTRLPYFRFYICICLYFSLYLILSGGKFSFLASIPHLLIAIFSLIYHLSYIYIIDIQHN